MLKVKSNFSRLNQNFCLLTLGSQHSFLSEAAEFLSGHQSFLALWAASGQVVPVHVGPGACVRAGGTSGPAPHLMGQPK